MKKAKWLCTAAAVLALSAAVAGCGGSDVYIENKATALLYIYTPYQPNEAALAAGAGEGDSCSSYGNRNFSIIYRGWFGDARH